MREVRHAWKEKVLLEVEEARRILGVSRWKIYELIHRGELPVLRIGRLVRIPRRALEEWIVANTRHPGSSGESIC